MYTNLPTKDRICKTGLDTFTATKLSKASCAARHRPKPVLNKLQLFNQSLCLAYKHLVIVTVLLCALGSTNRPEQPLIPRQLAAFCKLMRINRCGLDRGSQDIENLVDLGNSISRMSDLGLRQHHPAELVIGRVLLHFGHCTGDGLNQAKCLGGL